MGWGEQLQSGKWRAVWRDADGRRHSTTGPHRTGYRSKADAERVAGQKELDSRRGVTDPNRSPTWAEWRIEWEKLRRVEAQTQTADTRRLDRYVAPRWGTVRLNRIRREQVQAWVNELAAAKSTRGGRLSASTVTRIYHLLSASLKAAVNNDRLAVSPCRGIQLPVPGVGHERYLTRTEVDAIVHHMHDASSKANAAMYRALVVVGTETGLRFGELAGLHWQRVDFDQSLIYVAETWDPEDRCIKPYPKGRRQRAVPISDRCLVAFDALLVRRHATRTCGLTHLSGRCRSPLVFLTAAGVPVDAHNFGQRQWAAACKAAQVEGATPHDMRHTYASWLRQAGVDLQTVQELLGHASITTTMRYSHLGAAQHDVVRRALNT